ncbi:hypothetical protein ONE63_004541 [Megalurothrips usitatus]|uniref:Carboxylesterase type B domain-containing protein n=1 Tax=Megalurothrips usitatus TaxID=439358 RepID=A0AAV7X7F6_9NEOP|nr:hypothetical protein ONE63_004541 [Megalurothrips usitatus]
MFLFSPLDDPCPAPLATVETGILRGKCRPARDGRPRYAAFLGIPYAKPPTGPLRFKSPRPADAWDGVRDASVFGTKCIQKGPSPLEGSEDCLYLNVYSSWMQEHRGQPLVPVMVHIHGGGHVLYTGNIQQPDYFVASGLVVVTFNYRLTHFGFLNLDNDEAPGNAALKDMIAALRWVNRNIRQFGGDPDKVTIHSCSSAAADAHWLTLLPETEGLFRGAIIKSGSALATWGFTDHHRDLSDPALAALRRWRPGVPDDALLQQSDPVFLITALDYAEDHRDKLQPQTSGSLTISLENRTEGEEPRLIKMDGESYVLSPAQTRSRVPLIMGITNCEYKVLVDRNLCESML